MIIKMLCGLQKMRSEKPLQVQRPLATDTVSYINQTSLSHVYIIAHLIKLLVQGPDRQ